MIDDFESLSSSNATYTWLEIVQTAEDALQFPLRLLAFDGEQFRVYSLNNENLNLKRMECPRCLRAVALIVGALQSRFSERFSPGKPPFQILFSDTDITRLECMQSTELKMCKNKKYAPILAFGSGFKDHAIAPNIKVYPNDRYTICLTDWLNPDKNPGNYCWERELQQISTQSFGDLVPHLVWRGAENHPGGVSDYGKLRKIEHLLPNNKLSKAESADFLLSHWDELRFRLRAVVLSLKAETLAENRTDQHIPWIDARFVYSDRSQAPKQLQEQGLGFVLADKYMDLNEMSQAKYQLDLGGASGTSWKGFIYKLAMPGVVFHQEGPTEDWFFDQIKPWVHYVPIKTDLSDLHEKFIWAERNPEAAENIAEAGRRFVKSMTEDNFIASVYHKYFVKDLGHAVNSYSSSDSQDIDSILDDYRSRGFEPFQTGYCDNKSCSITTKAKLPPQTIDIPMLGKQD